MALLGLEDFRLGRRFDEGVLGLAVVAEDLGLADDGLTDEEREPGFAGAAARAVGGHRGEIARVLARGCAAGTGVHGENR
ncbi:hypothetical protein [Streptomyces sp. NPDC002785]|uniref:hypothetical protein n=1 Tax=Streptomyces sp. NPDC002785 TaxID=3154543 RepID=UPI00332BA7EB